MRILIPVLLVGAVIAKGAFAIQQEASGTPPISQNFAFHGDGLGETWADFQGRHSVSGVRCRGDADTLKSHGLPEPSSSDIAKLPDLENSDDGHVLVCGAKDFQSVIGIPAHFVEYHFFADKLYKIKVVTRDIPNAYETIKSAYVEHYGAPKMTVPDVYQSKLGAVFDSEHVIWVDLDRMYQLTIADVHRDWVAIDFVDTRADTAQKKLRPKKPADM